MNFADRPLSYRAARAATWAALGEDAWRRLAYYVRQVEDGFLSEDGLPDDVQSLLRRAVEAARRQERQSSR
jgi:hypothetical protein